jgi:acetyl-CoA carboxylase biotin carboxyl carrier protein
LDKDLWGLTEDEVRQVGRIIDTLNQSTFDYLQIEVGELRLILSKGPVPAVAVAPVAAAANAAAPATPPATVHTAAAAAPATAAEAGTVAIVSPMVGRFYLQPEPCAPPFVAVGSKVTDNSTVGLIEVMKTFNAVHAGVAGIITEICAPDTTLVEYGQVLFRVKPVS